MQNNPPDWQDALDRNKKLNTERLRKPRLSAYAARPSLGAAEPCLTALSPHRSAVSPDTTELNTSDGLLPGGRRGRPELLRPCSRLNYLIRTTSRTLPQGVPVAGESVQKTVPEAGNMEKEGLSDGGGDYFVTCAPHKLSSNNPFFS
ncbi:hypothetical protein Bbelb_295330 [Branchiostoma belcheri]|nr:hypothetical protein Bbelb_295330 [Branchiostoma belcheri]